MKYRDNVKTPVTVGRMRCGECLSGMNMLVLNSLFILWKQSKEKVGLEWYWVAVTGLPVEAIASSLVRMTRTCF